jgi:hypothetical protein
VCERAEKPKNEGYYFKLHDLQALAIETADACAEWLHRRIREDWGFPDPPEMTMKHRFTSHYRGKRYSFGYPACPNLEDQAGIWKLLEPEKIGVQLTEGFMMDPGSQRQRAGGVPRSGLHVLQRRGGARTIDANAGIVGGDNSATILGRCWTEGISRSHLQAADRPLDWIAQSTER